MIKEINYGRKLEWAAFGRNGGMHQSGLSFLVPSGEQQVWLSPLTGRGRFTSSARLSIPVDKIDAVIEALQAAKAKLLQRQQVSDTSEANQAFATSNGEVS